MMKSLQAGRALAALAVVSFHFYGNSILPGDSSVARFFRHGNLGVDFFFVLSGFIILFAHERDIGRPERLGRYFRNRFVRIYPIYWLYTAIFAGSVAIFGGVTPLPKDFAGWLSSIALIRFSDAHAPLAVAWTLFYEVFFYLLFAVLIVSRRVGVVLFAVWLLLILAMHRYAAINSVIGPWTSLICLNFFLGMAACHLHSRLPPRAGPAVVLAGFAALVGAGWFVDRGLSYPVFELIVGGACAMMICGAAAIERTRSLSFGPLAMIGNASYTLYLIHVHFIAAILKLLARFNILGEISPDGALILTVGLVVAVSLALYAWVEKPMVEFLRSWGPRRLVPKAL